MKRIFYFILVFSLLPIVLADTPPASQCTNGLGGIATYADSVISISGDANTLCSIWYDVGNTILPYDTSLNRYTVNYSINLVYTTFTIENTELYFINSSVIAKQVYGHGDLIIENSSVSSNDNVGRFYIIGSVDVNNSYLHDVGHCIDCNDDNTDLSFIYGVSADGDNRHFYFTNNRVQHIGTAVITPNTFRDSTPAIQVYVYNNTFNNIHESAIYLYWSNENTEISNNTITNCATNVNSNYYISSCIVPSSDSIVKYNTIDTYGDGTGAAFNGKERSNITYYGNRIINGSVGSTGIRVYNTWNPPARPFTNIIHDNYFKNGDVAIDASAGINSGTAGAPSAQIYDNIFDNFNYGIQPDLRESEITRNEFITIVDSDCTSLSTYLVIDNTILANNAFANNICNGVGIINKTTPYNISTVGNHSYNISASSDSSASMTWLGTMTLIFNTTLPLSHSRILNLLHNGVTVDTKTSNISGFVSFSYTGLNGTFNVADSGTTSNVSGYIYSIGTTPIENAVVYLSYANGSYLAIVNTSLDGSYNFTNVNNTLSYYIFAKQINESSAKTTNFTPSGTTWKNLTLIDSFSATVGQNIYVNLSNSFDFESDILAYSTNRSNLFTDFSITTGRGNWTTLTIGNYTIKFGASDSIGFSNKTISVIINTTSFMPPTPINLNSTQGNFWINYTWQAGIGNITESYNVSQNGTWTNSSIQNYSNKTIGAHGWSNISVWAFNNSGNGSLNLTAVSNNTQIINNPIIIQNVSSSYNLTAGQYLLIDANYTDLDGDTGTFADNASEWNIGSNGLVNWTSVAGVYNWQINVSDGYGSISMQNFSLRVVQCNATISVSGNIIRAYGANTWVDNTCINATLQNSSQVQNNGSGEWIYYIPLIINGSTTKYYANSSDTTTIHLNGTSYLATYGGLDLQANISSWNNITNSVITGLSGRGYVQVFNRNCQQVNINNSNISYFGDYGWTTQGLYLDAYGYPSCQINISNTVIYKLSNGLVPYQVTMNLNNVTISSSLATGLNLVSTENNVLINNSQIINSGTYNIYADNNSYINISNTLLKNSPKQGVHLNNISHSNFINVTIIDSGYGFNHGGFLIQGSRTHDNLLLNSNISNNTNQGVVINNGYLNNITGNYISYNGDDSIGIMNSANNNTIFRNIVDTNGQNNTRTTGTSQGTIYLGNENIGLNSTRDNIFIDNVISNNTVRIWNRYEYGAWHNGSDNPDIMAYCSTCDPIDIPFSNTMINTTVAGRNYLIIQITSANGSINMIYNDSRILMKKNSTGQIFNNDTVPVIYYPSNVTTDVKRVNETELGYWMNWSTYLYFLNGSIIPSSNSMNVTVLNWNTSSKTLNQSSNNASVNVTYNIGDLPIGVLQDIKVNGISYTQKTPNSTGYINFNRIIGSGEQQITIDNYTSFMPPTPINCRTINYSTAINVSCSSGNGNITNGMNFTNGTVWSNSTYFYWLNTGLASETTYTYNIYAYNTGELNLTYAIVQGRTTSGETWYQPNSSICDLQVAGANGTLTSCNNNTFYNFTMTGSGTNVTFGTDYSLNRINYTIAYQLRNINGIPLQNTTSNYFSYTLANAQTYYIVKLTSGWGTTYISSRNGNLVNISQGTWNRQKRIGGWN